MDRHFGAHFLMPGMVVSRCFGSTCSGCSPTRVYMIVLPAMGIVSDALPVFCRRPLVGYTAVALSTVVTMMIGFGVWVHHMFATGLPVLGLSS
jgi:cytochrome c oxidase subunit I+III